MTNDDTSPSPSDVDGDASSEPPRAGRSGAPAFLGRPDAGEGPAEFTRRFLEALLGKDDPRVKNFQPKNATETKGEQR